MNCRLCHEEKEPRRSHIIPAFFRDDSGTWYPTGKSGNPQSFTEVTHTHPGKRFQRKQHGVWEKQLGMIEHLLCHSCEQNFSTLENYAKRFFYGGSQPIRFQLPLNEDVFVAEYKMMKLFQLSLLWRASEAKGEFFSAVDLNDENRERLRQMLLSGDPGEDIEYPCMVSRLVASLSLEVEFAKYGIAVETGSYGPTHRKVGAWDFYTLVMGGLVWVYCVGRTGLPEIVRNAYLKQDGKFHLFQIDADSFLGHFARKVVGAGNVTRADAEESVRARHGQKA